MYPFQSRTGRAFHKVLPIAVTHAETSCDGKDIYQIRPKCHLGNYGTWLASPTPIPSGKGKLSMVAFHSWRESITNSLNFEAGIRFQMVFKVF
jgi:hypothetical protein